jgi:hypothetical protein
MTGQATRNPTGNGQTADHAGNEAYVGAGFDTDNREQPAQSQGEQRGCEATGPEA